MAPSVDYDAHVTLARPELRLRIVENKAETLSIAIRRRGEIFLKMSRASNNHCRFCNDAAFQDGTFWPFEAMARMIDDGLAQGVRRVFLSGGEPTIHPRFLDVIAYATSRGAERVICITNGRMFAYPEFADRAVKRGLSEAFVALLGSNAGTHDWLTQVPGSFDQTRRGIENLIARGVRVQLSTVVTARNLGELSDILTLIPGVTGLTAVRVSPAGRALFESLDELGFDVEAAREPVQRARQIARERGLELKPKLFPASFYEGAEAEYTHQEEYLPEIKDTELRTGLFGVFMRGEGDVACRGETCRVCYRRPFCDALYRFRERLLAGGHPVVACDLRDPVQRDLLPRVLGERRLWVTCERADGVVQDLRDLGVSRAPELVLAARRGDGELPLAAYVVLPASDVKPEDAADDARTVIAAVGGADDTPIRVPLWIATHERFRDEQKLGVTSPALVARRGLPVYGLPRCLAPETRELARPEDVLDLVALAAPDRLAFEGFVHHWLRSLHREHGETCRRCAARPTCAGLHVNHARQWGFGVLHAIEEPA